MCCYNLTIDSFFCEMEKGFVLISLIRGKIVHLLYFPYEERAAPNDLEKQVKKVIFHLERLKKRKEKSKMQRILRLFYAPNEDSKLQGRVLSSKLCLFLCNEIKVNPRKIHCTSVPMWKPPEDKYFNSFDSGPFVSLAPPLSKWS